MAMQCWHLVPDPGISNLVFSFNHQPLSHILSAVLQHQLFSNNPLLLSYSVPVFGCWLCALLFLSFLLASFLALRVQTGNVLEPPRNGKSGAGEGYLTLSKHLV